MSKVHSIFRILLRVSEELWIKLKRIATMLLMRLIIRKLIFIQD